MINYDLFFSLVDIEDSEKECAKHYFKLRGLEEHIRMAKHLASFSDCETPTYKEVATAFRYDKRIRRIIYKYIGLLEEYFRATICNKFASFEEALMSGKKDNDTLYKYCLNIKFSSLTDLVFKLYYMSQINIFVSKNSITKSNLKALNTLRNKVAHNYTLINYLDFREVNLGEGQKGNTLALNIKNLYNILPNEIAKSFKDEINHACEFHDKKLDYQVKWKLPSFLCIDI